MSYHTDPDWRLRPAPIIDKNRLRRLRRRARARGLHLSGERDGYHRAMGVFHLYRIEANGQTCTAIFGPTTDLGAIDAKLASIPVLKRYVVSERVIDFAAASKRSKASSDTW
jgi:hypothetical protein